MEERVIHSNGILQHVRIRPGGDEVVVFIHGNGSDSIFWENLLVALPEKYTCYAPDLRGYGKTEAVPADASRSFGDFVEDILALLKDLKVEKYHLVNHSLGGGISWELLLKDSENILSLTAINPASPFGFGGTCDEKGTLTYDDGACSGAGVVNPLFVECVKAQDRSTDQPVSPLNVMNAFYWNPPYVPKNIEGLLEGLLRIQTGEKFYPGDFIASSNFPGNAPGNWGPLNAASPLTKKGILDKLISLESKPPVLWVRGDKDAIVSDHSQFDVATLGLMGLVLGYPGKEECPPQPMVSQTRYVLERYAEKGGEYREVVMENCGHSPYIESQSAFVFHFLNWIER